MKNRQNLLCLLYVLTPYVDFKYTLYRADYVLLLSKFSYRIRCYKIRPIFSGILYVVKCYDSPCEINIVSRHLDFRLYRIEYLLFLFPNIYTPAITWAHWAQSLFRYICYIIDKTLASCDICAYMLIDLWRICFLCSVIVSSTRNNNWIKNE